MNTFRTMAVARTSLDGSESHFQHVMYFQINWVHGNTGPEFTKVCPVLIGEHGESLGVDMCGRMDDADIWDHFGDDLEREYEKVMSATKVAA